jgi:hypothetical protein
MIAESQYKKMNTSANRITKTDMVLIFCLDPMEVKKKKRKLVSMNEIWKCGCRLEAVAAKTKSTKKCKNKDIFILTLFVSIKYA